MDTDEQVAQATSSDQVCCLLTLISHNQHSHHIMQEHSVFSQQPSLFHSLLIGGLPECQCRQAHAVAKLMFLMSCCAMATVPDGTSGPVFDL